MAVIGWLPYVYHSRDDLQRRIFLQSSLDNEKYLRFSKFFRKINVFCFVVEGPFVNFQTKKRKLGFHAIKLAVHRLLANVPAYVCRRS